MRSLSSGVPSHRALSALYRRHCEPIYRYALARMGSRQHAEDLTAEVFTRAVESLPRYDPSRGGFRAWLYGIARHACADFGRRRQDIMLLPLDDVLAAASYRSPRLRMAGSTSGRLAVGALSAHYRRVLELRVMEGRSVAETAEVTRTTVYYVKVMQHPTLPYSRRWQPRLARTGVPLPLLVLGWFAGRDRPWPTRPASGGVSRAWVSSWRASPASSHSVPMPYQEREGRSALCLLPRVTMRSQYAVCTEHLSAPVAAHARSMASVRCDLQPGAHTHNGLPTTALTLPLAWNRSPLTWFVGLGYNVILSLCVAPTALRPAPPDRCTP